MRNFRFDSTFTFCDNGETLTTSFECSEANLDIWKSVCEEGLNVFVDHWNGRRGSMTSYAVVEIDPQPEVKGVATSNRGIL